MISRRLSIAAGIVAVALACAAMAVARASRSTIPSAPIAHFTADKPFFLNDGLGQYDGATSFNAVGAPQGFFTSGYWVDVPAAYDTTNRTPITLLVWMHGCEGSAFDDINTLTSEYSTNRPWIMISLSGPEGGGRGPSCWNTESSSQADVAKVLRDVAQVETHFNIDRSRVIIAGYSSGGNLAYQTIFQHASTFAGILAMNTHPVADNSFAFTYGESTALTHAIAAASRRFPIVQLSHAGDGLFHRNRCGYRGTPRCTSNDPSGNTSPDPGMAPAITTLRQHGFPVTWVVLPGHHYQPDLPTDCDGAARPDPCKSGSYYDIAHTLLPYITRYHWRS